MVVNKSEIAVKKASSALPWSKVISEWGQSCRQSEREGIERERFSEDVFLCVRGMFGYGGGSGWC